MCISSSCIYYRHCHASLSCLFLWLLSFPLANCYIENVIKTVITKTKLGPIRGVETTVPGSDETVLQYRRVPFAKPPLGNLRFSKPKPIGAWNGTLDATEFGPSFMQDFDADVPNKEKSEDCLYLNIYVPVSHSNHSMSVMVREMTM